jgi:hypothetical protein
MVVSCVNYHLFRDHESGNSNPPPRVDSRWAKAWIARNPELFIRRQQPLFLVRAVAHDEGAMRRRFNGLAKLIHHHRIKPQNTWNFDETGFPIGGSKSQWVTTFLPLMTTPWSR